MLRICLAILFLLVSTSSHAADYAGYARGVEGEVKITRAGTAEAKDLHKGDDIGIGDRITTGKDSKAHIEFADDSEVVIAQNGKLVIDKYVYDPKTPTKGKAEFTILDAAFSYVSGWMDKNDKPDVRMNLNFGSIGIRGTKLMRAMAKGECWIYLDKGAIDVYNKGGKVTLAPGEGTIMSSQGKAPEKPHIWPRKEKKWIFAEIEGKHSEWKP